MSTDPRQYQFWADELGEMWDRLYPVALRILFAGAQGGAQALPPGMDALVDWDVFNQSAIDYLNRWGLSTLLDVNKTTQTQTIKAIDEWLKSGRSMRVLIARLEPIFGAARAERIAVTEVTRMFAEGNILAWKSTGYITEKRWRTAMDERVCPICGPLENRVVSIEGAWDVNIPRREIREYLFSPPAHVNCRCWLQPVVSEAALKDIIRRR